MIPPCASNTNFCDDCMIFGVKNLVGQIDMIDPFSNE